jgi:hypothetical protein
MTEKCVMCQRRGMYRIEGVPLCNAHADGQILPAIRAEYSQQPDERTSDEPELPSARAGERARRR